MDKRGFIYIMTNDSMPGLIKVGRTKKVPTERAGELSTTGIPKPFQVQYYAFFDDMIDAETIAHEKLTKYHEGKEFYKIDVVKAMSIIESINIPFKRLYRKVKNESERLDHAKELIKEIPNKPYFSRPFRDESFIPYASIYNLPEDSQLKWSNEIEVWKQIGFTLFPRHLIDADVRERAEKLYQEGLNEKIGGLCLRKMTNAAELGHAKAIKWLINKGLSVKASNNDIIYVC